MKVKCYPWFLKLGLFRNSTAALKFTLEKCLKILCDVQCPVSMNGVAINLMKGSLEEKENIEVFVQIVVKQAKLSKSLES